MEGPTRAALEEVLSDLQRLPDEDPHKAAAIVKVQRQLVAFTGHQNSPILEPKGLE